MLHSATNNQLEVDPLDLDKSKIKSRVKCWQQKLSHKKLNKLDDFSQLRLCGWGVDETKSFD